MFNNLLCVGGNPNLIYRVCWFLWCKYSHRSWFYTTGMRSLNAHLEEMCAVSLGATVQRPSNSASKPENPHREKPQKTLTSLVSLIQAPALFWSESLLPATDTETDSHSRRKVCWKHREGSTGRKARTNDWFSGKIRNGVTLGPNRRSLCFVLF